MIDDTDALLDDILSRWHQWCVSRPPALGYPTSAAGCRLYRSSRQHDSDNGALDHDAESERMGIVEFCIDSLEQPYRTAIQFNARNLATGAAVWASPRLPQDRQARAVLVAEARGLLMVSLRASGVL